MLNALFGSEARIRILGLLLLHPEGKYSLRQLASELKLAENSIRRELENLSKLAILKAEKARTQEGDHQKKIAGLVYSANENFLLYPEIKALFIKAQILSSQKFLAGLQKIAQIKFLALTGFFTNAPESPTDILMIGNVRKPAFLKLVKELERGLKREINFTIMSEKEFLYRRDIMDIFLYNILNGQTVVLVDGLNSKA